MNRTGTVARPVWSGLRLGGVAAAILTVGCASYRVTEIDASDAMRFDWNGRVRITERTAYETAHAFTRPEKHTRVTRIDLLGENDRNVIIRPSSDPSRDNAYACVQDVGSPPDQYLVPLRRTVWEYEQAWQTMLAKEGEQPDSPAFDRYTKAMNRATKTYEEAQAYIEHHEFDRVNAAQLAFACAMQARQMESKYRLDASTWVRVSIDDGSLLTVTVEDLAGNVLHSYTPQPIPVVEVEDH